MTSQMSDPDPKKATARIVLNGLFLMWRNPWGDLEIGFVKCAGHELKIGICRVRRGSPVSCEEELPKCDEGMQVDLGASPSIDVQVAGAAKYRPVTFFPEFGIPFSRPLVENMPCPHPNHFGWMFDMRNDELHQGKVGVNPNGFSARMRINSGLVYTVCRSEKELDLLTWECRHDPGERIRKFGFVAEKTAVQIECDPGEQNGLRLKTGPGEIWLPNNDPEITYEISLQNRCDQPSPPDVGTDFRQFYQSGAVVLPPDQKKYDFRIKDYSPEVPQLICNGAFIGTL